MVLSREGLLDLSFGVWLVLAAGFEAWSDQAGHLFQSDITNMTNQMTILKS